jgi:methyltransferase-like protein
MNSEYANQNAYDAISIHGGSGFIMEYKSQRLFRDARIFSIYEGTTQLQVVAAIRYITNGTMLQNIKDMMNGMEVLETLKPVAENVKDFVKLYEVSIAAVKELNDQEAQDFLARRLYDITAEIVMSILLLRDATKAPELFEKSANVYIRMVGEDILGKANYIANFKPEYLESFRAAEPATEE